MTYLCHKCGGTLTSQDGAARAIRGHRGMTTYCAEWEMFMDGYWHCHDFMAELMAQGLSRQDAEREYTLRSGEQRRFDPLHTPGHKRAAIIRC